MNRDGPDPLAVVGGIVGGIFAFWLLLFVIGSVSARSTPQAGQIGVVREGSSVLWVGAWFNGHSIKKVIPPGAGSTGIGLGSDVHYYPADSVQRNYTITSKNNGGDRPGVDVVEVPTSDGIRIGLEGTFYFTTAFNSSTSGTKLVKDFDNRFGVRTFHAAGSNGDLHPWDGGNGWAAFLDVVIRPILDNDLRQEIAKFRCADLQSSCALVFNQNGAPVKGANGQANNATIQQIQDAINQSLQADIKSTLGQDYFSNIQFRLARVTLPDTIQEEIDKAQAQYAAVGTAQAKKQQATIDAETNAIKEKGFQACPACAQVEINKSIPSNITVWAPGGNTSVPLR